MDKFFDIVNAAIALNKENRERFSNINIWKIMSPAMACLELCTVSIDIGRQVGKTRYVKENATRDDLVIVTNQRIYDDYLKHFSEVRKPLPYLLVWSGNYVEKAFFPRYSTIWIDDVPGLNKNILYETLARDEKQTFIFLGCN